MNDLNAQLDEALVALRRQGCPVDTVLRLASMLPRVVASSVDIAFAEFHSAAGRLDPWNDREIGALILERVADGDVPEDRRERLYREASFRARWHASEASSAGDGMWRMKDVQRIESKMTESPTKPSTTTK